jgi:hypothetical protein
MDSRKQFLKTVNHQQPDRVVIDLGSTAVTGIHVHALSRLRRHYGLQRKPIRVIEPFQMLGEVDWEMIDPIGIDVIGAWGKNNMFGFNNHGPYKEWKTPWGQRVMVPMKFNVTHNDEGDILMHPEGDTSIPPSARMPKTGYFFDAIIRQDPIDEESLNIEDNLEEFGLLQDKDLEFYKTEIHKAWATGKAVVTSIGGTALGDIALVPGMQMRHPKGIRDVAEWYMSTLSRPDHIQKIFDRQTEIAVENLKRLYSVAGNKINAIFICGTDLGTQSSTFCSSEQFRELWLPYYKKMNDWIHLNTEWKTFKHCCGAVETLLKDFIDSGFDIINPVQINATGMDPELLKKKYGRDLVFWGGGIDTQKTLPFGTPAEVREQVLRHCDIFNRDGGFVFNTVHNIQANVPVENMVAMFDAIREFNGRY